MLNACSRLAFPGVAACWTGVSPGAQRSEFNKLNRLTPHSYAARRVGLQRSPLPDETAVEAHASPILSRPVALALKGTLSLFCGSALASEVARLYVERATKLLPQSGGDRTWNLGVRVLESFHVSVDANDTPKAHGVSPMYYKTSRGNGNGIMCKLGCSTCFGPERLFVWCRVGPGIRLVAHLFLFGLQGNTRHMATVVNAMARSWFHQRTATDVASLLSVLDLWGCSLK